MVETQVALDPRLTTPADKPPLPPFKCRDRQGRRTVCTEDLIDYMQRWQKVGSDSIRQVESIRDLQPEAQ